MTEYPPNSAGRLMIEELMKPPLNATISQAIYIIGSAKHDIELELGDGALKRVLNEEDMERLRHHVVHYL